MAGGAPCPSMIPIGNPTSCSARTAQAPAAIKQEMPSPGKALMALRTVPQLQNDVSQPIASIYYTLSNIYIYIHIEFIFIYIYIHICVYGHFSK